MSLCLTQRIEEITCRVTGRAQSLFQADCDARADQIREAIRGRRILVAGGAGSIGSATIIELLRHRPAALAVLDPSENNLAELVRTIRAGDGFSGELSIEPLPYGSAIARAYLASQKPFDLVLSFAALKHVRSERDSFSSLRMLEVNLLEADHFLASLRLHGHGKHGVFFVSTDKAANPVSLMGASKRAMELLLHAHSQSGAPTSLIPGDRPLPPMAELKKITSTRFANVAFSDGSLPWGFLQRLEKSQPLAAPKDIRRYLVSPRESGQLCMLAALCCAHQCLMIPDLDPARDLVSFIDIAAETLRAHGLEPAWYDDEASARAHLATDRAAKRYPVLRTISDTSGEKEIEEFVGSGEQAIDIGLKSVRSVAIRGVGHSRVSALLMSLDMSADYEKKHSSENKRDFVKELEYFLPGFAHRETGRSLDGKM